MSAAEQRAQRLARFYPAQWRARYGDEFVAMLSDDIAERPRSLTRTFDVARAGMLTRLHLAGVSGEALEGEGQLRAGLVTIAMALGVFLAAALAIWSQLTIGWRWAAPSAHATRSGMVLLSLAMALFAALAVAALVPLGWSAARSLASGGPADLRRSMRLVACGAAVLIAGSIYFDHGWPGTVGHNWAGRDVVPVAVARVCWAATFWISTYWAHPHQLLTFPAIELAWMVISPAALIVTLIGAAKTLRRMPLSARLLRYESWLGAVAGFVMAAALAGAGNWVLAGSGSVSGLYRSGAIDAVGVAVMGVTLVLAFKAARRNVTARLTTG
jgi:hypothetical protein